MSTRRYRLTAVCIVLSGFVSLACTSRARDLRAVVVRRVPADEELVGWARQKLGCDPCDELQYQEKSGAQITYLVNPALAISIPHSGILEVRVLEVPEDDRRGEVHYALGLRVSEHTERVISNFARSLDYTLVANFYGDKLIGVELLQVSNGIYFIGTFDSRAAAEAAATGMSFEATFVPLDPIAYERLNAGQER